MRTTYWYMHAIGGASKILLIPVSIIPVNISTTASGLINDPVYIRVVLFQQASQQHPLFHSVSGPRKSHNLFAVVTSHSFEVRSGKPDRRT